MRDWIFRLLDFLNNPYSIKINNRLLDHNFYKKSIDQQGIVHKCVSWALEHGDLLN